MKKWVGLAVLAVLLALCILPLFESNDCWNGWNALSNLRGIAAAQREFREKDLDRNGKQDYWRKDIAGLYMLAPEGAALELIEKTCALADARPACNTDSFGTREAKAGYLYYSLRFADEPPLRGDQWAASASPPPESGTTTFIVNSSGSELAKDLGDNAPPEVWPTNPASEGWITIDELRRRRWRSRNSLWWIQFWRDH